VRRAVRKVRALGRLYYGFMRLLPINPKLVVFSEYWGTGFGCNPRAIFEEMQRIAPDLTAVWILDKSKQGLLPPGVKAIEPNGVKQWAAFARAKYFVNNVNIPGAYVKRPGQVHIQTMHGTPLKFCGLDVMGKAVAGTAVDPNRVTPRQNGQVVAQDAARNRQEFVDLLRRSDRWDYALSSNAYSTEMWSHAYPCSYSWLEFGYPRNDVLVRSTPADVERCRSALGVSSERTLVLYAPTFRESAGDTSLRLDLESLIDALPDDFVLLVRAHHTTSLGPAVDRLEREGRLINGSRLPSIVDCYLAADILITDYSSVMFDFAILDKPIVIYADDWDAYRESRGTYFDLLAQPPGAVAVNQTQLTTILADRQYSSEESRRLLAEFRERFCSLDDGHAAENVIRRVMLQA
jgi:CDP-glycerol glycerophosphotransferase (TagB/SpsB family)